MALSRAFSFEGDEQRPLDRHAPYHDSPERHQHMSPPPGYASPEPHPQISPVSSVYSRRTENTRRQPSNVSRRPVSASSQIDSLPPVPPPHRQPMPMPTTSRHREDRAPVGSSLPADASQAYFLGDRDFPHETNPYSHNLAAEPLDRGSHSSNLPLAAGATTPGSATVYERSEAGSYQHSRQSLHDHYPYAMGPPDGYHDSPYLNAGRGFDSRLSGAEISPYNIADDGDDGFMPEPKRKSILPMVRERHRQPSPSASQPAAAAAGAGMLGGLFGRKTRDVSAGSSYNSVPVKEGVIGDKSDWLTRQTKGNNKMRWIVGSAIATIIILAVIGGIVGGVLASKNSKSSSGSGNAASEGDLSLNSPEIQSLMNNKNLHKVFPGMDYTPWGTQYPLCMTYPPIQNNVTMDMAVLSQLTNTVRVYGTDCNQTQMVLHAIDRLQLTDMKLWLGVWIDTNDTTTQRQLDQMYKILADTKDLTVFKGAIIGNEALYRAGIDKAQSEAQLISILQGVKANFSSLNYNLPVATSDLGDNWNAQLVEVVDYVMSNIHPFFAGVNVNEAAAWTWDFWQTHDVVLTNGNANVKQLISETGWPSGGGTDCGNTQNVCAPGDTGSVASVDNMNTFMNDWVCQALTNGTDYFWFEAFDEPWKVVYNTPGEEWEDKWGLMDPGRNLKDGLVIPSCNGMTVSS